MRFSQCVWTGLPQYGTVGTVGTYGSILCGDPSPLNIHPYPNPYQHINTVTMSELIITTSLSAHCLAGYHHHMIYYSGPGPGFPHRDYGGTGQQPRHRRY